MTWLKKALSITLSFFLLFTSFFFNSCGDENSDKNQRADEVESIFNHVAENTEAPTETETETEPNAAEHLYVIIPKNASAELALLARNFTEALAEKTEILSTLKYDNELPVTPEGACSILVGNTDRLESENAMDDLKRTEYVCRWDTGSLVICGGSEASTIKALARFTEEILPYATKHSLMGVSDGFSSLEEDTESETDAKREDSTGVSEATDRATEDVTVEGSEGASESQAEESNESSAPQTTPTLNGYPVNDFVISYQVENKYGERKMAELLQGVISDKSGYELDVVSSDAVGPEINKTISVLVDESCDTCIYSSDGSIVIRADSAYMLSLVIARVIEDIENASRGGSLSLEYGENVDIPKRTHEFGVSVYFIKGISNFNSLLEMLSALENLSSDVFVLANANENICGKISENLPLNYKQYTVEAFSRTFSVVYNANVISKVSARNIEGMQGVELLFNSADGETIRYNHFLSFDQTSAGADFLESLENSICFFESGEISDVSGLTVVAKGSTTVDSNNIDYSLTYSGVIDVAEDTAVISDTSRKLACTVKVSLNTAFELLERLGG